MSQTEPHSQPVLTSVAAHLYVRDIKASTDFFAKKLGFSVDFVYGEPPFYGQVSRDNAKLALRSMDEEFFAEDIREREELLLRRSRWPMHKRLSSSSLRIRN